MLANTLAAPAMVRSMAFAKAYRQHDVETRAAFATPHQLIQMLFDGFVEAIMRARGALHTGDIPAKCTAISRAARIVDEGLKGGLNLEDGGQLAEDLRSLYDYTALRLARANLHNDERGLDECLALIQPLREAWIAIRPAVEGQGA